VTITLNSAQGNFRYRVIPSYMSLKSHWQSFNWLVLFWDLFSYSQVKIPLWKEVISLCLILWFGSNIDEFQQRRYCLNSRKRRRYLWKMTRNPSKTTRIKATLRIPILSNSVVMTQTPVDMTLIHANAIQKVVAVSNTTLPGPDWEVRSRFIFIKTCNHL
jgi:hypothetical protein